jgi:hypothetical protein
MGRHSEADGISFELRKVRATGRIIAAKRMVAFPSPSGVDIHSNRCSQQSHAMS